VPKNLQSVKIRPLVSYRTFQLGPLFFDEDPSPDDVFDVPGHGIRFNSSNNDFWPLVTLEHWDAVPPVPEGAWEYERAVRARTSDRPVAIVDLGGTKLGGSTLPPSSFNIRILCRGRGREAAMETLEEFPEEPQGDPFEFWVLQFWPV
jgi:hypothetical protein